MVRAGIKTKIFCLGTSALLEFLKYIGTSQVGAEYVYGCVRPALEDALALLSEEDYHRLMEQMRALLRETTRMSVSTWNYLKVTLSRHG